jgi:hypothetical protein
LSPTKLRTAAASALTVALRSTVDESAETSAAWPLAVAPMISKNAARTRIRRAGRVAGRGSMVGFPRIPYVPVTLTGIGVAYKSYTDVRMRKAYAAA